MRIWVVSLAFGALSVLPVSAPGAALADDAVCHHALSLLGEPKMPADYKHFDWVNPDAPKGGTLRIADIGGFDTLNDFSIQGEKAGGLSLPFDQLFADSPDEPSTSYGLIAECATYPSDFSSVTFKLRPEAKFSDATSVTPEDVIFSFESQKKANPQFALYYRNVKTAEKTGDHEVTFRFDSTGNRELPMIMGQFNVLSKADWENDPAGPRDITKSSMKPILGSGPYKIQSFESGRNIVYERRADYWAKDLPVSRGQWNFDRIRYEYFRDRVPAFEAFKNGLIDYWMESSATNWATQYSIPAVDKGLVKKEELGHKRVAGMQGFAFNTRRKQFSDSRVRRAFGLAMDFEEMNKKLFYGSYTRLSSYFDNSELKSTGLPQGQELEILNTIKDQVPPEVFTTEFKPPLNSAPDDLRAHLREAVKLLAEAGWTLKGGKLTNAAGEQLTAEFLLVQPDFERVVLPFMENLRKIGINPSVRTIDASQYERRVKSFDFDIIVNSVGQSHSPGNEQRFYFGSAAADQEGSQNFSGIKNPAIDKLVDRIIFAKDRTELVAATKALDRVLLWNFYVVPNWYLATDRVATWDVFGRPQQLPSQTPDINQVWWIDPEKQKAANAARAK